MRVFVASLVMLVVVLPLAGQQRTSTVTGSASDLRAFEAQLSRCKRVVGLQFAGIVSLFRLRDVPLHVSHSAPPRARSFAAFAFASATRRRELYLDRVLSLPEETRDGSAVTYPSGVPGGYCSRPQAPKSPQDQDTAAAVRSTERHDAPSYCKGVSTLILRG